MRSLNVRLVLYLLVPFVVLLPLGAALQYFIALIPIRTSLDRGLENLAVQVEATIQAEIATGGTVIRDVWSGREDPPFVAVLGPDGTLVAGDSRLTVAMPMAAAGETIFVDIAGADLHMAARGMPCGAGTCQVRIAEPRAERERLELDLLLGSVSGMAVQLLLIGIVMWFGARDSLAPVRSLRRQMEARTFDDLEPVAIDDPPDEVAPVVDAINELFTRLKEAAAANQTFVAAASHQLRTPLARMSAQLELALRQPRNGPIDQALLADLKRAVDQTGRLTHQLLALARSSTTARPALAMADVDLKALALQVGSTWVPRAAQQGADLGFEVQPAIVHGNRQLIGELLANLLDNALRYGGLHITVRTRQNGDRCELEVDDDGPGIPPAERDLVFMRFARGSSSKGEGSGLGLALVRQIAHLHGGEVDLGEGPRGGLRIRVGLPAASVGGAA